MIGLAPGPIIGILLMVTYAPSIAFVNVLSSVIYAIAVPYKAIGLTLLYLDRTGRSVRPVETATGRAHEDTRIPTRQVATHLRR
jgi:hypothetical protein